jgi:hypothetical protein
MLHTIGAALTVLIAGACTMANPSPLASQSPLPSNPGGIPAGRPISIDLGVEMSPDNRVVTLRFIGAPVYPPDNPCYVEYAGWANPADDVLQVAVVLVVENQPPPGMACPAQAMERDVEVTLDEPFLGAIARDLPFGTDIQITRSPVAAACSFTGESDPHFAPVLENQLPQIVAGRELTTWSAAGWCWVQLSLGLEGVARFRPIAVAQSLQVESVEYAQARRSGFDDPPNFIHAMRYPTDQGTRDFAVYLFSESIGLIDPETFDLSTLEATALGGKEVRIAPEALLQPSENDRGNAYFYDTDDVLFAVIASDEAWVEQVLSQLP